MIKVNRGLNKSLKNLTEISKSPNARPILRETSISRVQNLKAHLYLCGKCSFSFCHSGIP